jgi:TonB family protein
MRKMLWVLLCVLSATTACAESAKNAVNAFRGSLGKSQFVLRNFSGEGEVRGSWSGASLELDPPRWRTLGVLTVDSVRFKSARLMLECTRHVAVRDRSDRVVLYAIPAPVEISIDLRGADPAAALPQIKEALFYPSIADALAGIPQELRQIIPASIDKKPVEEETSFKAVKSICNCAEADCSAEPRGIEGMKGVSAPTYLRGDDPGYTDEARQAKLNGSVNVRLIVDKNGRPTDVWVGRPLGMGLDEAAARSVLSYVFRPAMCNKSPVSVYLSVDVKFEID